MTHEDKLMEWFKEHNVENLNKALTKQNEPIVIYDLEEFMDGQKLEDDVNVILSYGVLRKLYNEIDQLNTQFAESKAEGVGILYDILELREENKWLEEQLEKLDKYNSELCMELTITMDKLCLAEKEIARLRK